MDKVRELVASIKEQIKAQSGNAWTEEQLAGLDPDDVYTAIENEMQTRINDEKQKLVAKTQELLGEKKKLQAQLKDVSNVNVEEYEAQIEKLKQQQEEAALEDQKRQRTFENQFSTSQKEQKKLAEYLGMEKERVVGLLKKQALTEGLQGINIDPKYSTILREHLEKMAKIVEDTTAPEGRRVVCEFPNAEGKIVQKDFGAYLKEDWAAAEGKDFILNAASGGAGTDKNTAGGHNVTQDSTDPFGDLKFQA